MATTQDDKRAWLDALKEAYYSGVLAVRYADKSVTYQSAAEQWQAILRLEMELATRPATAGVVATLDLGY